MRREDNRGRRVGNPQSVQCPECRRAVDKDQVRKHIRECERYIPTYANNVGRFIEHMTPNFMQFLIAEMDIIKQALEARIEAETHQNGVSQPILKLRDQPLGKDRKQRIEKREQSNSHQNLSKQQERLKYSYEGKNNAVVKSLQSENPEQRLKENPKQSQQVNVEGSLEMPNTVEIDEQMNFDKLFAHQLEEEEKITCAYARCRKPAGVNDTANFTYLDNCLHTICLGCARQHIEQSFIGANGEAKCPSEGCRDQIPMLQLIGLIGQDTYNNLSSELNRKNLNLIRCNKCKQEYEFSQGKPSDAPKKTAEGKNLTPSMARHFAENRYLCPKCKLEQCKECKSTPYHLGYNCKQHAQHKLKKKCRYCREVLPNGYMSQTGIKTLDDICATEECASQAKEACSKRLACGHSCYGFIRQKNCPPCLNEKCALAKTKELHGINDNEYCSLCYVETLAEAPCIRSACGHIYHLKCLKKRLDLKWGTPRITFKFCECPLCNQWLEVPAESPLSKILATFKALHEKILEKALKRLKHEGEDKDDKLKDPKSPYYNNPNKYAEAIYAYFECFQCHQPYFGGRKSCAQAMGEAKEGEKFDPKELVCPSCCPVSTTDCKKHGKEYISFKCKFCCSIAQWFCWGSTHFCDSCHNRQIAGEYVSKMGKDKLPKCQGGDKCPIGGKHGGNGQEFCIGCVICRNEKVDMKDF